MLHPVDPAALTRLVAALLVSEGANAAEADLVAAHLADANLTGHDSHGVIRTPRYLAWLQEGTLKAGQTPRIVADTGALLQLDGGCGLGQSLGAAATRMGIARANTHGAAIIAMRRAGHIGRLGAFAEQAARAGLVSIQFCNVAGSSLVAPFGAAARAISTAPVAIGVPNPSEGGDFILDFATSMVAEGKVLVAAQGGKPLEGDPLVDAAGTPTADPAVLYGPTLTTTADPRAGEGALRTMGAHKGSGLALACELLAGALTGNGANGPTEHPFNNGWLGIFVDPARLDDAPGFAAEASAYVTHVRGLPPAAGTARVLVPGDKERALRAERSENGIPLPAPVLDALVTAANNRNLDPALTKITKKAP
ncbi:MAG: Ldh family oxidoreductase [Pseudomonadota bacterium]